MAFAPDSDSPTNLDEALFSLRPEGLGGVGSALGRTRLRTLMGLRWLAVAGQTSAVVVVAFILDFDINISLCLALIAASAWLNVILNLVFRTQRLMTQPEMAANLVFDIAQLAALLTVTGGLSNPFLLFLNAPVMIAGMGLRAPYVIGLAVLTLVLAALMPLWHFSLPWIQGESIDLPLMFEWGHFAALAIGVTFFGWSTLRVNSDEARLVRALDAAQVVMSREQRLSALGAMAAMTAHELGTPLATIHLVSREMARELSEDDPHAEDANLIAEQAERCRSILGRLAQSREASDAVHAQMPLTTVVEEASAPFRGLGVEIRLKSEALDGAHPKIPTVNRMPEVLHALGAFIENAVSFADTKVLIETKWSEENFAITIKDDGPGFAAEVLPLLGEPYVSRRDEDKVGGGDMGLGFFIAKTLIERTGGVIAMRNRALPNRGAVVQATWPRRSLEINKDQNISDQT